MHVPLCLLGTKMHEKNKNTNISNIKYNGKTENTRVLEIIYHTPSE
jgi:hypothetical protein